MNEKDRLEEYLKEYNFNYIIKNQNNFIDKPLNTRNIIQEFNEFLSTTKTSLKYLAFNLFHVNYNQFKAFLIQKPTWKTCKIQRRILYFLVNKFLKNKDEVLKNLSAYLSNNTKSVTIVESNEKICEVDQPDDKYWSRFMNRVFTELENFLNLNKMSHELFATSVLDINVETLNLILSKRDKLGFELHYKYIYKIEEFLNKKKLQQKPIEANLQEIDEDENEDEESDNLENEELNTESNTKKNMTSNSNDVGESEIDIVILDNNSNDDENKYNTRSSRNYSKNTNETQKDSSFPYDISGVDIEGKFNFKLI